jgi:hypothetical protein
MAFEGVAKDQSPGVKVLELRLAAVADVFEANA